MRKAAQTEVIQQPLGGANPVNNFTQEEPKTPPMGAMPNMAPMQDKINNNSLPVLNAADIEQYLADNDDQQDESPDGMLPPDGLIDKPEVTPNEDLTQPEDEEQPEDNLPKGEDGYPQFASQYDAMKWAADDKNLEAVKIKYKTEHGHLLDRMIDPHGMFYAKTTHRTILVAWDESVNDIRAFVMKNIEQYSFAGKKFKKKFQFNPL